MKLSPMTKDQVLKIVKAAAYIAVSGAISGLISYATDNKEALGVLWPLVNLLLVTLKQAFTPASKQ